MPGKVGPVQPRLRRREGAAAPVRSSPCSLEAELRVAPVLPPRRLSRPEARHSRCKSAIPLKAERVPTMTFLANGSIVSDLDNSIVNQNLADQGYSIRHIETFHDQDEQSFITWDAPALSDDDLPY